MSEKMRFDYDRREWVDDRTRLRRAFDALVDWALVPAMIAGGLYLAWLLAWAWPDFSWDETAGRGDARTSADVRTAAR